METTGQILGKAHRLCEWLRADDVKFSPTVGSVPLSWAVQNSSKWHLGNTDDLPDGLDRKTIDAMHLRLPAQQVVFECESDIRMADGRMEKTTSFFLCYDAGLEGIECFVFVLLMGAFRFCGGGRSYEKEGRSFFTPYRQHGKEWQSPDDLRSMVTVVERALVALSCTNVRSVDNAPPTSLNRKRQKAGKPPLFTYKTLHVLAGERGDSHDPRADDAEAKRSPRLHFRRSHFRRIGGGRITCVQQCMVGNRSLGIVEKVYALHSKPDNAKLTGGGAKD